MAHRALVLIDLQNDYFAGGKWTLHGIDDAARNAAAVLKAARENGDVVVHVHHEFLMDEPPFFAPNSEGAQIHSSVTPNEGEPTVLKHQVNAFKETNLKSVLDEKGVKQVTFVGAMSHMCIDAAARAASDFGYEVTVIEDACASRDLEFEGRTIGAEDVHSAYMSSLGFAYATVARTDEYLG